MPGEDRVKPEDAVKYEGLVFKTARLFHAQVGIEFDDFCQEVRIKVVKARRAFDPSRSRMTEGAYVYACVANLVKDMKAAAAIRRQREQALEGRRADDSLRRTELSREEVYGLVDNGSLMLPNTISPLEREVLFLLGMNFSQVEIAERLNLDYYAVGRCVRSLRLKLADWRPAAQAAPEVEGFDTQALPPAAEAPIAA